MKRVKVPSNVALALKLKIDSSDLDNVANILERISLDAGQLSFVYDTFLKHKANPPEISKADIKDLKDAQKLANKALKLTSKFYWKMKG